MLLSKDSQISIFKTGWEQCSLRWKLTRVDEKWKSQCIMNPWKFVPMKTVSKTKPWNFIPTKINDYSVEQTCLPLRFWRKAMILRAILRHYDCCQISVFLDFFHIQSHDPYTIHNSAISSKQKKHVKTYLDKDSKQLVRKKSNQWSPKFKEDYTELWSAIVKSNKGVHFAFCTILE